jgi:hypothetical protein
MGYGPGGLLFESRPVPEIILFPKTTRPAVGSTQAERPGRTVDHSLPRSNEPENEWSYASVPHTFFHDEDTRKFTFYFTYRSAQKLAADSNIG